MERRPDPDDRRAYRLHLRHEAEQALGDIRTSGTALLSQAMQGIDEAEAAALASALRKMRVNLSSR
ncbi:hypothetical protein D3C80_1812540 [compost metagenome]